MEPVASTSRIETTMPPLFNDIDIELHFLIAKYLSIGPCLDTYTTLIKDIEENKILPKRLDWKGSEHLKSYGEFENENCHIPGDFLRRLVSRLGPAIQRLHPSFPTSETTLLGSRAHSLLRTEKDSFKEYQRLYQVTVRFGGKILVEPLALRAPPNSALSVIAKELTGSANRSHFLTNRFYNRLQLIVRNVGHLSAIYCLLFDRRGRIIITGADDMLVKIWSVIDGRLIATLRGASAEISDLAIDQENILIAAGSCDKIIRVWNLQTLAPVAVLCSHTGMVTSLQFCPAPDENEGVLVSTGGDGCVAFWTYTRRQTEVKFDAKPLKLNERVRPGHAQLICASFSAGGHYLAIGGADHFVRVYRLGGNDGVEKLIEVEHHTDRVDSIQWCHSGIGFVSGSRDGIALVWKYQRQQWKTMPLKMTDVLPGFTVPEEESKRLQVTMVGWERLDRFVITASSDHLIRVWDSHFGSLRHILKGHEDNVYVIEAHPTDMRLILTAGHDGLLFIWDVVAGKEVKSFKNSIEGQGYGALFDAKWAPDGLGIAATDSHGHILLFGIGDDILFKKVPQELFFHTDYRPLVRDVNHHVLDEQTQMAPHVMPPPFLVNIDGDPYPPSFQRLVPGRENCREDQLVPNVILNDFGDQEVMDLSAHEMVQGPSAEAAAAPDQPGPSESRFSASRPSIDDMIERLEQERRTTGREAESEGGPSGVSPEGRSNERRLSSSSHHPDHSYAAVSANGPLSPRAGRVGSRREGDIEGVRQSTGNWQRHPIKWKKRVFVIPLSRRALEYSSKMRMAYGEEEIRQYEEEARKSVEELGSHSKVLSPSSSDGEKKARRRQRRQNHAYSTRAARTTSSGRGRKKAPAARGPSQTSRNQASSSATEERTQNIDVDNENQQETSESSNDEDSSSSSSSSSSEEEVEREVLEEEAGEESTSSDDNSTDYSDWTADVGVGLEPPKRTIHKQKRVNKKKRERKKVEDAGKNEEDSDDNQPEKEVKKERRRRTVEEATPAPVVPSRMMRGRRQVNLAESEGEGGNIDEIPPEFRPPEWLSETVPKKAPYFPQMGDEVMYFRQGHLLYVEAVVNRKLYQIDKRTLPWLRKQNLRDQEFVKIIGMKFEIKPPRLCCLKLGIIDGAGTLTGDSFTIKYHDTPDVLDFLVLKKTYDTAVCRNWSIGDRFRCIIDDAWWLGMVEAIEPHLKNFPDSVFMCYRVLWDNGERERLSPWDMEPIDEDMELPMVGGGLQVTPEEYKELVYTPSLKDWNAPYEAECSRIANGVGKIMELSAAEAFLTPVDLNVYPNYAMIVEYPTDLSTIKSRLESHFYRRPNAVQFDVRYIATNAEKFNKKGTTIVKHGRIITDLALRLIKDKTCLDPTVYYHEVQANYQSPAHSEDEKKIGKKPSAVSSDSEDEYPTGRRNPRPSTSRRMQRRETTSKLKTDDRPWQVQCRDLLKSMFERQDSVPFRYPVDQEQYDDYNQVIDVPMDLTTIREELATGSYQSALEYAKDVRLVFSNSKTYNTNNKSRIYSMTVRLEAFFEDQFKPILSSWKSQGKTRGGRARGRPPQRGRAVPPPPQRGRAVPPPPQRGRAVPPPPQRVRPVPPTVPVVRQTQHGPSSVVGSATWHSAKSSVPAPMKAQKEAEIGQMKARIANLHYNGNLSEGEDVSSDERARGSTNEGGMRRSQRVAKLRRFLDITDDSDEEYNPNPRSVRGTPSKVLPSRSNITPSKSMTRSAMRPSSPIVKGKGGPTKRLSGRRYEDDSDFEAPAPSRRSSSSSSKQMKKKKRYEIDSDFEANTSPREPPIKKKRKVSADSGSDEEEVKKCNKRRGKVGAQRKRDRSSSSEDTVEREQIPMKRIASSSEEEEEEKSEEKTEKKVAVNGIGNSETSNAEQSEESSEEESEDESYVYKNKTKMSFTPISVKTRSAAESAEKKVELSLFRGKKRQKEESEVEFDDDELEEEETDEDDEEEKVDKKKMKEQSIGSRLRRTRKKKSGNDDDDDENDEDYVHEFIDDDDASSNTSKGSSEDENSDSGRKRRKMSRKEKERMMKEREKEAKRKAQEKIKELRAKERDKMKTKKFKEKLREKAKEIRRKEKEKMKKMQDKLRMQHKLRSAPTRRGSSDSVLSHQISGGLLMSQSSSQHAMPVYTPNSGMLPSSSIVPFQINPQTHQVQEVRVGGKIIGRKITSMSPPPAQNINSYSQSLYSDTYISRPIIEDNQNMSFVSTSGIEERSSEYGDSSLDYEGGMAYSGRSSRPKKRIRYTENDTDEDGFPTVSSRGRLRKVNSRMKDYI